MSYSAHYKVLIVGDSRLRYIESELNNTSLNVRFTVKMIPGARMASIKTSAKSILAHTNSYHLTLIIGGINDMSRLAYLPTKHALPRFGNTDELVTRTMDAIRSSIEDIRSVSTSPVIMSTIAGMDFAKYSPDYADLLCPLQQNFNKAVVQINNQIRGINRLADLTTVNLAYPVHRCNGRGRYATQYLLLHDGLHPSEDLLNIWVHSIIEFCADYLPNLTHAQIHL